MKVASFKEPPKAILHKIWISERRSLRHSLLPSGRENETFVLCLLSPLNNVQNIFNGAFKLIHLWIMQVTETTLYFYQFVAPQLHFYVHKGSNFILHVEYYLIRISSNGLNKPISLQIVFSLHYRVLEFQD